MNEQEVRALSSVCLLAANADGARVERERETIARRFEELGRAESAFAASWEDVSSARIDLDAAARGLVSPDAKRLAFEMAVCVCEADGARTESENTFLEALRTSLGLEAGAVRAFERGSAALAATPVRAAPLASAAEIDATILNTAILCAALEQLPQGVATLAILPLQMRMVYRIGKQHGFELDRGHIGDFLAAAGVGMTAQVLDGFARKLIGGLAGRLAGGFVGGLTRRATGSALAFATTYAIGRLAQRYYESGRSLSGAQLRDTFASLVDEARGIESRYSGDIARRSREVNLADLATLVQKS